MRSWFITGANRGMGLEIARTALAAGDQVVAASRKPDDVRAALGDHGERLLAVPLDVTNADEAQEAVKAAVARFGGIDVLVNNAGFAQIGPFEANSHEQVQRQFDTNVFGTFHVTRAALPVMRAQRSGHIFTISSLVGLVGFGNSSLYCATKFALEGWSESIGQELAEFGIKVTLLEPGQFRTDFLDQSSVRFASLSIDDYMASDDAHKAALADFNHQQIGDPSKMGDIILAILDAKETPVRVAVGSDALATLHGRGDTFHAQADAWRALSLSTDFPTG
ncbi:Short-chain dehydrogenase [Sphingobium sp. AP50]|uniref:SDR family NAD(P)-dependent oxidoreductase n=1 Tax=Sphingobium sp. AP50 TaxID=1884369 RepID=UPI0008D8B997|nr:SDR family NAD(P)-dependent oxidoreductase [Sphingobium sp. AP50]SEJ95541.1 Short-chain dehydrogenase [Sphingobium sp. AP50]